MATRMTERAAQQRLRLLRMERAALRIEMCAARVRFEGATPRLVARVLRAARKMDAAAEAML